ncbi:MAG: glycosyl transferase, family 2 [Bryobacterales bacterium]|nr:glycosyl transferase, family 2 [Bryobacterales bacterium]
MILFAIAAAAGAYQLIALVACLAFRRSQGPDARGQAPGASILKPIHGADPALRAAIKSHTVLEGDYELLCGVRSGDPAAALIAEFPTVRMVECTTETPNGKVGSLIDLARAGRYPILIVNDADIRVEPDYLAAVVPPLADPRVGLVTCLYRPEGDTFAARFEGLGVSTDFAPSTLVARLVGVDEFALGSTMSFRRADLDRIGGFQAIADYLADDYQLGHRIHALGLKCVLSDAIVTTRLTGGWRDVWRHQVRWARTVRVSKFWGYLGLPVTFATLWVVAAAVNGYIGLAAALLASRMVMATAAGWYVLGSSDVLRLWFLIPLRDLFGAAIWIVGLFGQTVSWRDRTLALDSEGRIRPK